MGNFSFSSLGVLFLLLVLIPNACWCFKKPKDDTAERENRWLQTCEQLGQVLTTIALLIDGNLNWHGWSNRCWWLILASCFIFLYEWFWVRYFRSDRNLIDFYRPLVGVRVPGATFPILSFLCLALYGRALVLGFATFLLGVGHIGIHLSHEQEIKAQLLNQVKD